MVRHAGRPAIAISIVLMLAPGAASAQMPAQAPPQGGNNPFSNSASNIGPQDTQAPIAPALPEPDVGPNAGPFAYLRAARVALATGKTGEAQQALEMAETRILDRSTKLFQTNNPSRNPLVAHIAAARQALGAGNASAAMAEIDQALSVQRRP
jgi:hypothetical protein